MMRAVALTLSIALLGCFPHNPKARTYAELAEGATILAGIGLEAVTQSGADCDQMEMSLNNGSCHTKATVLGDAGIALILGGLLGFVATISTAEEEKAPPKVDIKAEAPKPEDKPALTLPGKAAPAEAAH